MKTIAGTRRADAPARIRGLVIVDGEKRELVNVTCTMHAFTRGDWYSVNGPVMHQAIRDKFRRLVPELTEIVGYALLTADDATPDGVRRQP